MQYLYWYTTQKVPVGVSRVSLAGRRFHPKISQFRFSIKKEVIEAVIYLLNFIYVLYPVQSE